ncbi:uncharacterized protein HMPREF1541_00022 [Cyphellophora europaea CBS 101466]|uniref:Uncharacterized protein n=1 Tax=Cyphellophora europaea (strain CBS 101466) TaxID=1220924 RepID=W2SAU6_CYPE1|nr:uncharacterized protein HMPREF1541_00022 [Cyphellophora europaea CBS 101466]ETN45841.1 hypothetical protein HMPREF1541_00022 [Cyphellophora europaea CBS 101466]
MEAAELLNPKKVKQADRLTTSKARREWLNEKDKRGRKINHLDKYPITHVDVKFQKRINEVMKRLRGQKEDVLSNWEVSLEYRSLYRKDQIKAEAHVYEAAQNQAKRFTEWY